MSQPRQLADVLESFGTAPASELGNAMGVLWNGIATANAEDVAAGVRLFDATTGARRAWLALWLGVVAEQRGDLGAAVADGVERYLAAFGSTADDALNLALFFLLAHLPRHAERILAAAGTWAGDDDRTRLECSLAERPAPAHPLGRVWPAPATWALPADVSTDGTSTDDTWVGTLSLTAADVEQLVDAERQALWAYSGAKATHAVQSLPDYPQLDGKQVRR